MKMQFKLTKAEIEEAVRAHIQTRLGLAPEKVGKATLSRGRTGDDMAAEVEADMPDAPATGV